VDFLGEKEKFEFYWREPMDYLAECVTNPALMAESHFHSSKMYLVRGSRQVQMVDEPWTAGAWEEIEVYI
jgi:hypothetical protein